jgi:hypothetical protein
VLPVQLFLEFNYPVVSPFEVQANPLISYTELSVQVHGK